MELVEVGTVAFVLELEGIMVYHLEQELRAEHLEEHQELVVQVEERLVDQVEEQAAEHRQGNLVACHCFVEGRLDSQHHEDERLEQACLVDFVVLVGLLACTEEQQGSIHHEQGTEELHHEEEHY